MYNLAANDAKTAAMNAARNAAKIAAIYQHGSIAERVAESTARAAAWAIVESLSTHRQSITDPRSQRIYWDIARKWQTGKLMEYLK